MFVRSLYQRSMLAAFAAASVLIATASASAQPESQLGILDLAANGGINPATGAAWAHGDTYRLMFTTSMRTPATSTDIATYNAFVQNAANNSTSFSNLGDVSWSAIASTAAVDARDNTATNIGINGPGESIFLLNGSSMVAADYADMWGNNNNGDVNVYLTENLTTPPQGNPPGSTNNAFTSVWTGTYRFPFPGDPLYGTADGPLGDIDGVARGGLWGNNNNGTQWIHRFEFDTSTQLPLFALSEPLNITDPSLAAVPEPASIAMWSLIGMALAGFGVYRRRRKK